MVTYNEVNHYFYVAFHPVPDDAVIADRMTRYHDKLAAKVPAVGRTWEEQWKPDVISKNEPAKTADYSGLSDAELVAKLDEFTDHMRYQWWIHGHINFVLLSSSAFCDLYDKIMEPAESDRVVPDAPGLPHPLRRRPAGPVGAEPPGQGQPGAAASCSSTQTPSEVAGGARRERRGSAPSGASSTSSCSSSAGAATPCTTSPTCRGGRTPRSRWPASPASWRWTTARIPSCSTSSKVAQREELMAAARAKLADDPELLEKFDELYEPAVYSFPLTEDHAFYIDQLGVSVFRRFALVMW